MAYTAEERKERALESTRKWREANRDRANELARNSQKKWREANPELHRKRAREYAAKDPVRRREVNTVWRHANKAHVNAYRMKQHYKNKYGLTIEERDALLSKQGGCACCGTKEPGSKRGWVVDHCHITNVVRGILCHNCNLGIGHAKDSIELLKKMITYLERYTT